MRLSPKIETTTPQHPQKPRGGKFAPPWVNRVQKQAGNNRVNICELVDLIFRCRNRERYLEDYNFMCFGCFEILCQKYCRPGPSSGPLLLILSEKFNNQTSLPLSMEKEGEIKSYLHRRTKHLLIFFRTYRMKQFLPCTCAVFSFMCPLFCFYLFPQTGFNQIWKMIICPHKDLENYYLST